MKRSLMLLSLLISAFALPAAADVPPDIQLPAPTTTDGMPLMQALMARHSDRTFSEKKLPLEVISDLLWAADGINRSDSGKRTAPSALNWQEIDIYVVLEQGSYRWDPKANVLRGISDLDHRHLTGMQDFVATAPMNLVYVADVPIMKDASPEEQVLYSAADTGVIAQNVYLYCASQGLATVVRGSIARDVLSLALKLPKTKTITLAQSVGYPGEEKKEE